MVVGAEVLRWPIKAVVTYDYQRQQLLIGPRFLHVPVQVVYYLNWNEV